MKTNQHTAEQIIKILDQAATGQQSVADVCREHGIAETTFYRWRKAYGGMSVNAAQRLKELERENSRLKRLLAEWMLENDLLRELLGKRAVRGRATRRGNMPGERWIVGAARLSPGVDPSVGVSLRRAPAGRYVPGRPNPGAGRPAPALRLSAHACAAQPYAARQPKTGTPAVAAQAAPGPLRPSSPPA